ncbi:MAG: MATE family efflux transporter [Lachnospiraceae bacterium]|nr:MATE family efflux transporter [Lachnospiraceae bacterium]
MLAQMAKGGNQEKQENQITEGVIWQQLLIFFFPVLLGTFFQQLYNAADVMIVGRFLGKEALSAVGGTAGMLTHVVVGFFVGLSSGAAVLVSQYYGAKRPEMVGYAVHTFMAFSMIMGVAIMILGIWLSPWILVVMGTPKEVVGLSTVYLRIYFLGTIGNLLYNTGASILRAVGDSKRPLYFLMISCTSNILLDLLMIAVLKLGVAGAAAATILSQLMSAVMVMVTLMRTKDMHHLEWRKIGIDRRMLQRMIRIGFPSGLQAVMYGLSNMIIQSGINSLGTDTVAAWTVYTKIEAMVWMLTSSFGIAITTFAGQNYGAGKMDRVRGGVRSCMGMMIGVTIVMSVIIYYWGGHALWWFTSDPEVIRIGIVMMRYLSRVYVAYVAIEILSGALRGVGDSWIPMMLSFGGVCLLRVLWILFVVPVHRTIRMILFSYPMTWTLTTGLFIGYYLLFSRMRIVKRTGKAEN